MLKKVVTIAGIMSLAGSSLLADFTYQETSTITGGMMMSMMKIAGAFNKQAREPIQSTVAVKGDMMVHRTATHASVIDLATGTITSIDFQKKQYSVMTFEEMKQMMEQMSQKMQKNDKAEMQFKVSADATGKTKQVAGFEAKEMIMKMEMQGTDKDMFMSNPQVSQGMAEVYKEVAKLDGMPVQQLISMGMAGQPPAAGAPSDGSAAPAQQQPAAQPQQQQSAPPTSVGGALGSRFGLGRKKPAADQQAAAPANGTTAGGQPSGAPGSLLEMTTELGSFSSNSADASLFAVPAGFKKVDSDLKKMK